jgi:hypothetical protein
VYHAPSFIGMHGGMKKFTGQGELIKLYKFGFAC